MNGQSAVDGIMTFSRADVKDMQSEIKEGTLDYDRMTENNEILVQNNALLKEIFGANLELGEKLELTFSMETQSKKHLRQVRLWGRIIIKIWIVLLSG